MGYYSDVVLVLSKRAVVYTNTLTGERAQEVQDVLSWANEKYTMRNDVLYEWTFVKWYLDYSSYIDWLCNMFDEEELPYYFIRIGEDYSDIEERGDYYDNEFDTQIIREVRYKKPTRR